MAKVDDLLAAGTVTQDPDDADKVVFNVPLYIKKDAVNADGFEAFAGVYGWTAQIDDPENPGTLIDNPVSVYDHSIQVIWGFVRDVFRGAMMKQAEAAAKEQAQTQIDALMS